MSVYVDNVSYVLYVTGALTLLPFIGLFAPEKLMLKVWDHSKEVGKGIVITDPLMAALFIVYLVAA